VIEVGCEVFGVRGIVAFSGGAKYANTIERPGNPISHLIRHASAIRTANERSAVDFIPEVLCWNTGIRLNAN
jgi:hypothetical protein